MMRLVQTQLVAYRLSLKRKLMEKRNSSWSGECEVPPQQNSRKRPRSFSVPLVYSSHHMHRKDNDETQCTALNEWQLTLLRWVFWAVMFAIFLELEFGTVFFILSLFYFTYLSLRSRSWLYFRCFCNKKREAIDGSTAEQFERKLRYKTLS